MPVERTTYYETSTAHMSTAHHEANFTHSNMRPGHRVVHFHLCAEVRVDRPHGPIEMNNWPIPVHMSTIEASRQREADGRQRRVSVKQCTLYREIAFCIRA